MRVSVKFDTSDFKAGLEHLRAKFPGAIRRALLRAGTSGRAEMVRAIAADTGLQSSKVRDEIKLIEVGSTQIDIEVQGGRLPLIAFNARGPEPSRGRGRGVSYRLVGGRGRAPHAFIATMRSGHRGVFQRSDRSRTPIAELHGPSLPRVFEKHLPAGAARAEEALIKNLRHEIEFAMRRSQ